MPTPVRSTWLLGLALAWLGSDACVDQRTEGDDDSEPMPDTGEPMTDTGAPACDPRPEYPEVYASCTGMTSCGGGGRVCAYQAGMDPTMDPAYCTTYCTFSVECPAVGTCTAEPICLTPSGGGTGACALDCGEGKQCPEGMECLEDTDSGGIRYICF